MVSEEMNETSLGGPDTAKALIVWLDWPKYDWTVTVIHRQSEHSLSPADDGRLTGLIGGKVKSTAVPDNLAVISF